MAEYLVSSCGFDPDEAAKASKLLGRIESRHQPDSVLGFFKSHGFDNAQMKRVLSVNPRWLLLDVEKTLAPKFRALQDLGFSCSDITHLVSSNNAVINHKLQNVLSKIQFWQGTLGSNDLLMKLCKRNRWFLSYNIEKKIQPNIEILRDFGITEQKLSMIPRSRPLLLAQKAETLKALIGRVEGLGVARTSGMFLPTLSVLQGVSEQNFKAHLEFFKGFGWSEDDFLAAFRKVPSLVTFSLKSLQRKMEFLVNETRCAPSYLAPRPRILSLKKKFLERFVIGHKEFPELIELYNLLDGDVFPIKVLSIAKRLLLFVSFVNFCGELSLKGLRSVQIIELYIYIYIYVCVCVCMYVCIFVCVCVCVCMFVCIYICMYVCMFIYIYICVYTYVYVYIYVLLWDMAKPPLLGFGKGTYKKRRKR
ncbi:unnamed protein product [Musa acuminata var. zebrina]